jgi:hypothetical protein
VRNMSPSTHIQIVPESRFQQAGFQQIDLNRLAVARPRLAPPMKRIPLVTRLPQARSRKVLLHPSSG